jgi:predicted nucleic acid-binding protein
LEGKKIHVFNALKMNLPDIADAIFYQIALENQMDAILTSDKAFLKLSKPYLPILSLLDLANSIKIK